MKISLVLLIFFGLCLAVALAHRGHSHGHGGHSHSHGHHQDHAHSHSHSHSHSHHHSHDHSGHSHSHSHDDDHSGHSHDHDHDHDHNHDDDHHDAAPESTNDDQPFVHDDQPFVHEDQPFVHEDLPILYSDDTSDILIQRVPYDPDEESDIAHEHHEYHEYQYAVPIENTVNVMAASADLPVLNQEGPGNGLGNGINWVPLEHAFKIAHDENRYTIVIIHKKACRASVQFAASASSNPEFERLSKAFVMVNVLDTEEPLDPKFHPDGSYFPRVLFFDTEGNLVTNLIRYMGDRQIVYYYPEFSSLEGTMKMALEAAPFTMEIAELLGPNAIGV